MGKEAPNYDYNDPIFKELGVKSMDTPRTGYDDPKGNVMRDKLEQAFHEWHGENEQKKSDISK